MSQNKEKIVAAGKDLAASGQSSSELELDSQPKMWRVIESANAELASLGVSVAWDRETSTCSLSKGAAPAPVAAPEPVAEDPEPADDEPEEEKPSKWGL
tara:strand:- start:13638 stop:13934 length:297 start_codon:yes stop_codon:yes gene_type:complete